MIKTTMAAVSLSSGGMTGALTKASVSLLAIGAAVTAGYLAYQSFTSKSREADERTREVAAALGDATEEAWDYAEAAAGATGQIDGFAVAQRAIGLALVQTGEDGEKLTQAFGALGLQISDVGEVLLGLKGSDGARAAIFHEMGAAAGIAGDQLGILAGTIATTDENGDSLRATLAVNLRDGLGISTAAAREMAEELMPVASAMEEIDDQSEMINSAEVAQTFLRTAAASSEAANSLVEQAEAQSEATRNGDDALLVYYALNDILAEMSPSARSAAEAQLGLGESTSTGGDAAVDAAASYNVLTDAWTGVGETATEAAGSFDDINDALPLSERNMLAAGDAATDAAGSFDDINDALPLSERNMLAAAAAADEIIASYDVLSVATTGVQKNLKGLSEIDIDLDKLWNGDVFSEITDGVWSATDAFVSLEDAVSNLAAEFDRILSPGDDLRESAMEIHAAFEDLVVGLEDTAEAGIDMADAYDITTEAGRSNMNQLIASRDAIYAHGSAMLASGATAEQAAGDIAYNTNSLFENMRQAGVSEEAIAGLNREYFLTPEEVVTAIEASGIPEAGAALSRHRGALNAIPGSRQTLIRAILAGGDVSAIAAQLANLARTRIAHIGVSLSGQYSKYANRAAGGYVGGPELGWTGEAGAEAVIPLTRPGRIRELMGDPRISGPLMSAMAGSGGSSVTNEGSVTVNVYNNGRDLTPADISRALVQARAS